MNRLAKRLSNSIASRTLFTDAASVGLMACGFGDKYLVGLNSMYKAYKWVNKKMGPFYREYLAEVEITKSAAAKTVCTSSRTAWVCWLQGIDAAPVVVKQCYASINKWLQDWDIVLITAENFSEYATLPDFIVDKWKNGVISNTHFSDILRLQLLIEHGGLWLDATTMLTGAIPDYVLESGFFVFHNGWMDEEMINIASWFIYSAQPQFKLLIQTRDLIFAYWKKFNYLKNYFLLHMLFRIVTDANEQPWNEVPYYNQIDNHLLMIELQKPFNAQRVEQIKALTPIHKLTYKLPEWDSNSTVAHLEEIY